MIDSHKIQQAADIVRTMDDETREAFVRNMCKALLMMARAQNAVGLHLTDLLDTLGIIVIMIDGKNGMGAMDVSWGVVDGADEKAGREIARPVHQLTTMIANVVGLISQGKHVAVVETSSPPVGIVTPQTPPVDEPGGGGN